MVAGNCSMSAASVQWCGCAPDRLEGTAADPLASTGGDEPSHLSSGDSDRDLLAGLGTSQHLADVVAELFLGDPSTSRRHGSRTATRASGADKTRLARLRTPFEPPPDADIAIALAGHIRQSSAVRQARVHAIGAERDEDESHTREQRAQSGGGCIDTRSSWGSCAACASRTDPSTTRFPVADYALA